MKHARRKKSVPVRWPVVLATVAAGAVLMALGLLLLQAEREGDAPAVLAAPRGDLGARGALAGAGNDASSADVQPLPEFTLPDADGAALADGAAQAAAPAEDGSVEASFRGRVLDAEGRPVSGALVQHVPVTALRERSKLVADKRTGALHWGRLASTLTGADGRFELATRELPRTLPEGAEGDAEGAESDAQGSESVSTLVNLGYGGNFRTLAHWAASGGEDPQGDDLPEPPLLIVSHADFALHAQACDRFRSGACDVGDIALQPGLALKGRITDPDGRVVADARVAFAPNSWVSNQPAHWQLLRQLLAGESGSDGRFRVESLWAAEYEFQASHPDFVPDRFGIEVSGEEAADIGDLALQRGRAIHGRVLDDAGAPLAGASVLARPSVRSPENPDLDTLLHELGLDTDEYGSHEARTTSAADGSFVLSTLNHDRYSVIAEAPGREPAAERDVRVGAQVVTLRLSSAASALITVVDENTGLPIPGVTAKAWRRLQPDVGEVTRFDPELDVLAGAAALAALGNRPGWAGLPPATSAEPATAADAAANATAAAPAMPAPTVPNMSTASPAMLAMPIAAAPSAASAAPAVAAAPVTAAPDPADGLLVVQRVGAERTDVVVSAPGYATHGFVLAGVAAGELHERTLRLWREAVITGRVLDAGGEPIPRAQILVRPPEYQRVPLKPVRVKADAAGAFRVGALTHGEWNLRASAPGYLHAEERPVGLSRAQLREGIDLVLERSAVLTGIVLAADGVPAVDVTVYATQTLNEKHQNDQQRTSHASTDEDGRFRFDALHPGTVEVRSWPGDPRTFLLNASQPTDVVLSLLKRPIVRGRVTAGGQPVANAMVAVAGTNGHVMQFNAQASGDFEAQLWQAGEHAVSAGLAQRQALSMPVTVHAEWGGVVQLALELKGVSVSGRVIDEGSGQPVAGVVVTLAHPAAKPGGVEEPVPKWLQRQPAQVSTDADGAFRFEWVAPGECELSTRMSGRRRGPPLRVTVGAEPLQDVELVLPVGQGLRGTLRTASGAPLPPSVRLFVKRDDGGAGTGWIWLQDDGSWEARAALDAGSFRLTVTQHVSNWFGDDQQRELASVTVKLAPGEQRVLDLTIDG